MLPFIATVALLGAQAPGAPAESPPWPTGSCSSTTTRGSSTSSASTSSSNEVHLTHAGDGARGLAALEQGAFDAVLLDVMMPGMTGLEVMQAHPREVDNIPVIMLTAKGDETDRVVGLELGADDYVPKPFSPRELLARLRAVIRRAQPRAVAERLHVGPVHVDVADARGERRRQAGGAHRPGVRHPRRAGAPRRAG